MNKSLELNFLAHTVQQYRLLIRAVFDGGLRGCTDVLTRLRRPPHWN